MTRNPTLQTSASSQASTPGRIITAVLHAVVNVIDYGLNPGPAALSKDPSNFPLTASPRPGA
jgi:hypothetical protein